VVRGVNAGAPKRRVIGSETGLVGTAAVLSTLVTGREIVRRRLIVDGAGGHPIFLIRRWQDTAGRQGVGGAVRLTAALFARIDEPPSQCMTALGAPKTAAGDWKILFDGGFAALFACAAVSAVATASTEMVRFVKLSISSFIAQT
jgi:hypothetical protein